MPDDDRDGPSKRQLARKERRDAGDRSSDLARKLMEIKDAAFVALDLEEDLRTAIARARAITAMVARRRAERQLAGDLRRFDIDDIVKRLANVQSAGVAEPQLFHKAERWRTRLLEEGPDALASFPGGPVDPLPKLIADAQREKLTGKPPGAARALFRHVLAVLRTRAS